MNLKSRYSLLFQVILMCCALFTACEEKKEDEEPVVPSIVIEPDSIALAKGESFQLTAKVQGVSSQEAFIRWSSNASWITVDETGLVTAIDAHEFFSGVYITAELGYGKAFARCLVVAYEEFDYKYRLILKDKGVSKFSVNNPQEFLSAKAIERRKKRNIPIDKTDLPISADYIKEIEKIGGVVVAQSKWLNTVSVHLSDVNLVDKYKKLPFVEDVVLVWRQPKSVAKSMQKSDKFKQEGQAAYVSPAKSSTDYGTAWENINMNNGQVLHESGFKGTGIDIALIDGGFADLPKNSSLNNITIKGAKSFIYENSNPYDSDTHGLWVLSCMATNKPGYHVGTAPEANYWLLRTEDHLTEYPIEEDYWVAAIEYADSVGVDIVNTSLYYTYFDWPIGGYKYEDMDGKTALATRGTNMAIEKGIFIVCCAGNHGSWVGTPSDAPYILTVGSVRRDESADYFTAWGITVDGRMKPDVMALGGSAGVIDIDGNSMYRSGTSYASPILCGLAACLWQAYPKLTNKELFDIIKKSADRYNNPELPYGYGIPDMQKAIELAQKQIEP